MAEADDIDSAAAVGNSAYDDDQNNLVSGGPAGEGDGGAQSQTGERIGEILENTIAPALEASESSGK